MVVIGSLQQGRRLTVERVQEEILLIDGSYSASFDADVFHLAMVLQFAPHLLEVDRQMQ